MNCFLLSKSRMDIIPSSLCLRLSTEAIVLLFLYKFFREDSPQLLPMKTQPHIPIRSARWRLYRQRTAGVCSVFFIISLLLLQQMYFFLSHHQWDLPTLVSLLLRKEILAILVVPPCIRKSEQPTSEIGEIFVGC